MALQHLRASTANKRPTPAAMADGQLAMNTNLASPGLFFKDSNGDLVKTGPVHVGTTAPNATPASGGQAGNSKGELWLDTTGSDYTLKTWDGSAWREIVVTSTMIKDGTIVNADINASAAIVDTKLATIATAGKVSNSATTATNANTASAIVARDASGNFSAGTVTASLTGAASLNVLKAGDTMTGVLAVTAGTAALPAITPSGDPNTGIFSPGADQLAISTNGAERLLVDSTGTLTVTKGGTSGSIALFQAFNGSAEFKSTRVTGGSFTRISGTYAGNVTDYWSIGSNGFTDGSFAIWAGAGNAERLRITSDGKVGLGTSSPESIADISEPNGGDIYLTNPTNYGGSAPGISPTSRKSNGISWRGNIVTGFGSNATIGETNFIRSVLENTTTGDSTLQGRYALTFGTASGGSAQAQAVERLRIDYLGRVGIGVTDPGAQLSVSSNSTSTVPFYMSGPGETYGTGSSAANAFAPIGTLLDLGNSDQVAGAAALINFNARNNSNQFTGAYIGAVAGSTSNGPANTVFGRRTSSSTWQESARIDSSGRLLVGTSTNSGDALLQVSGEIKQGVTSSFSTTSGGSTTVTFTITNNSSYNFHINFDNNDGFYAAGGSVHIVSGTLIARTDYYIKPNGTNASGTISFSLSGTTLTFSYTSPGGVTTNAGNSRITLVRVFQQ
jgi:hypothetical protein